ncbi:hypothetical protein BDY19DRAFT_884632 [Irpex rosettiformis]|uniref:Uncharacterized protein n=1 Tax=Irpex rosettiformis TaxID=378272 RepID=A0ACB8UCZ6_9APHY|nr:hypothetical protein BDY19DRAFT_884632 [Irpex rosettiformis]
MESGSRQHSSSINALDSLSIHRITSGQVVVDLQTAVKELVENSLDAGATSIEVRFKNYGIESIEVVDNGSGIAAADYDSVGLKHHTSKLDSFEALESVSSFGFRGEALSSLCALCSSVTITTATDEDAPMGTVLELDRLGKVKSRSGKVARQRGTTVTISELFKPLPVRRKELERNAKREYGKALNLVNAYALLPCVQENGGVRLTCTHQPKSGKKSVQLRTDGSPSIRSSVSSLWGPKTLDNLVELDLSFKVETEKSVLRRQGLLPSDKQTNIVTVRGLISKFSLNCGRNGADRQFYYINGRPCSPSKVQKAFNEVYKTFNATQSPMVIVDFILPKGSIDVNVSPDKRTILIHSEDNLVQALKIALEEKFAPERSTYNVTSGPSQAVQNTTLGVGKLTTTSAPKRAPLFAPDSSEDEDLLVVKETEEPGLGASASLVSEDKNKDSSTHCAVPQEIGRGGSEIREPSQTRSRSRDAVEDATASAANEKHPEADDVHSMSPIIAQMASSSSAVSSRSSVPSPRQVPEVAIQRIEPPRAGSSYRGGKQLVFNASGSFWHLSPTRQSANSSSSDTRPRKRQRTESEHVDTCNAKKPTQKGFKMRMAGFAMAGSQNAPTMVVDGDGDGDESSSEGEEIADKAEQHDRATDEPALPVGSIGSSKTLDTTSSAQDEVSVDSDIVMETEFDVESGVSPRTTSYRGMNPEAAASVGAEAEAQELSSQEADGSAAPEYVRNTALETSVMHYDEEALMKRWHNRCIPISSSGVDDSLANNINTMNTEGDDKAASEALSRVINKIDFAKMDVIGQFNLGFIVARRRQTGVTLVSNGSQENTRDDLFIIDQHAADEKYNFEQLQQTTRIESQALFRPKPLELTAADELVAIENIDVLRRNGFEIEIDDSRPQGGHRLNLVAQPVSKATVFDMRDLEELLHLLRDSPRGQMVRCSKARSMFAMRACRKSIMVGMPLQHRQMTSVVRHMGTMDQPWNCPHGRPTMRHLADISTGGRKDLQDKIIKWDTSW